ncbi:MULTISPECIES: hypothetical protein [Leisingera]|uniref:hypothetical protein n=1 Tax=Leisingera TaxID=191028 RepID=UPI000B31E0C8|nr:MULTISPECIES: hypothetical protein [Leisingera]
MLDQRRNLSILKKMKRNPASSSFLKYSLPGGGTGTQGQGVAHPARACLTAF